MRLLYKQEQEDRILQHNVRMSEQPKLLFLAQHIETIINKFILLSRYT